MGKATKVVLIGALGMVLGISALQAIGSNVGDDFAANETPKPLAASSESTTQTEQSSPIEEQSSTTLRGSTMLEQAILDAFYAPHSGSAGERNRASNAKDFVEASINAKGYLCADAVEMRQAAPGQYGIGCVMNRDGTGAAIYLVDSRTGSVTEI